MRHRDHVYVINTSRRAGAAILRCRWAWLAATVAHLLRSDYAKPGESI